MGMTIFMENAFERGCKYGAKLERIRIARFLDDTNACMATDIDCDEDCFGCWYDYLKEDKS